MSNNTADWATQDWMQDSLADSEKNAKAINDSLATGHWSLPWFDEVDEVNLVLGQRMGHYKVDELAGQGGFGQVYKVTDQRNGSLYALKLMRQASPQQQLELEREISVLRTLQLPGVVNYRDSGESNGRPFVVMNYLEGEPFLSKTGVDWADCAQGVLRLLETLEQLHQCGIAHLDLKPGNIVLTDDGPVLIDFGLSTGPRIQNSLSPSGQIAGTPQYLAPEQLLSGQADQRSDIYSLGVLLYRALSGRFPFPGGTFEELALRGPEGPDPLELPSKGLAQTILAMLAFDPAERPQSAAEVLQVLEPLAPALITPKWAGLGSGPVPESEVRASVFGPERIFAYPSRAAQHLLAEGAEPAQLTRTVQRWMRQGVCTWDEQAAMLRVDRAGLDRLEGWKPEELHHLRWMAPERLSNALVPLIQERREAGQLERAWTLNLEGLGTLERWPELDCSAMFRELVLTALSSGSPAKLDQVHERLPDGPDYRGLRALTRAGAQTLRAQITEETRALLGVVQTDPELEKWRHGVEVFSVRHEPVEVHLALVESKRGWADAAPAAHRGAFYSWLGRGHYRNSEFSQAIQALTQAKELARGMTARCSALVNLTTAYLDSGRPKEAIQVLDALKGELGHGSLNLRTQEALYRYKAEYRLGRTEVDQALLEALSVQPNTIFLGEAQLTSAAMGFRMGLRENAAIHVQKAKVLFADRSPEFYKLALALAGHLAGSHGAEDLHSVHPVVQLQLIGLGAVRQEQSRRDGGQLLQGLAPHFRASIHEILSPEECIRMSRQDDLVNNSGPQSSTSGIAAQISEGAWEIYISNQSIPTVLVGCVFAMKNLNGDRIYEQFRFKTSSPGWPIGTSSIRLRLIPNSTPAGDKWDYEDFNDHWKDEIVGPNKPYWWANTPNTELSAANTGDAAPEPPTEPTPVQNGSSVSMTSWKVSTWTDDSVPTTVPTAIGWAHFIQKGHRLSEQFRFMDPDTEWPLSGLSVLLTYHNSTWDYEAFHTEWMQEVGDTPYGWANVPSTKLTPTKPPDPSE